MGKHLYRLTIPYVPFSRQDRVNHLGESFSLAVFANLINSLGFQRVVVHDPHSDVTPALIHNCEVVEQYEGVRILIRNTITEPFWLVSPDAGALKKTHKLAQVLARSSGNLCLGIIESSKHRNTATGEITGTVIHSTEDFSQPPFDKHMFVVVDDICDGGRTFIELGKELRKQGAQKIHLYVTHGFFTKGKDVFNGVIDGVYAVNDRTKGVTL
jgi:ribose-phosphate pyrophosphokinase